MASKSNNLKVSFEGGHINAYNGVDHFAKFTQPLTTVTKRKDLKSNKVKSKTTTNTNNSNNKTKKYNHVIKTKKGQTYVITHDGKVYGEDPNSGMYKANGPVKGAEDNYKVITGRRETTIGKTPDYVKKHFKGKSVVRYNTIDDFRKYTGTSYNPNDFNVKKSASTTNKNNNNKVNNNISTNNNNKVNKNISSNNTSSKSNKTTATNTNNISTNKTVTRTNNISTNKTPKRINNSNNLKVSSSDPNGNYEIKRGDSLWKIAHDNGISLNELMKQNPQIKNINQIIHPGDRINVNNTSNNTNINNSESTTVKSKPNLDDIVLDDSKMDLSINTTPKEEDLKMPDKISPIAYNYKKKKNK